MIGNNKFELLFFDGIVLTGKFCVGVLLYIQSIYIYTFDMVDGKLVAPAGIFMTL